MKKNILLTSLIILIACIASYELLGLIQSTIAHGGSKITIINKTHDRIKLDLEESSAGSLGHIGIKLKILTITAPKKHSKKFECRQGTYCGSKGTVARIYSPKWLQSIDFRFNGQKTPQTFPIEKKDGSHWNITITPDFLEEEESFGPQLTIEEELIPSNPTNPSMQLNTPNPHDK